MKINFGNKSIEFYVEAIEKMNNGYSLKKENILNYKIKTKKLENNFASVLKDEEEKLDEIAKKR